MSIGTRIAGDDRALADAILAVVRLKPTQIGFAVEAMIDHLDAIYRREDPDEPDFRSRKIGSGDGLPGDAVDGEPDGTGLDTAWTEWHTRPPRQLRRREVSEVDGRLLDEDVEAVGDEQDHNGSEEDFVHHYPGGPGCPIADAGEETVEDCRPIADPEALLLSRNRIRWNRCIRRDWGVNAVGRFTYELPAGHRLPTWGADQAGKFRSREA